MGVFTRPDSPYWQLYLEPTKQKLPTKIRIGRTATEKRDSEQQASALYHQRMSELSARLYKLPSAQPAIRFLKYAQAYERDTIPLHRGHDRERELLKPLVQCLGDDLLTAIDADRVRAYMRHRKAQVAAVTVNREVDLLKSMLRDAAPKYLPASPIIGLKRLPTLKPKRRLLAKAEERRLLAACEDAQDRAILILGIDTLLRLGDLLDLEHVDRSGPMLYVRDPKGGEPYEVVLTTRAERAMKAIATPRYVFAKFRRADNPRDWPGAVRQRLQYLCRAADVPYGKAHGGITFHWATRRTGATRLLVERKTPLPIVQRQGNWKTPDVLLGIYAEAGRADVLQAIRGGKVTGIGNGESRRKATNHDDRKHRAAR